MSLSDEERDAIVALKMTKAETAYKEMLANYELGLFSTAANRLYYSMFYASAALLIRNNLEAHSHAGVRALMNLHFFKSELLPRQFSALLSNVFTLRQESDYDDFFAVTKDNMEPYLKPVKDYLDSVKSLLKL